MLNPVLTGRYWRFAVALPAMLIRPMANSITVSGSPATMTVNTAVAGQPPTAVTDASTTYTIIATGAAHGVTGKLTTALPAGVTLTVTFAACGTGTSYGPIILTTTAQNLVHGITTTGSGCTGAITYQLSATAAAGSVTLQSQTVHMADIALP